MPNTQACTINQSIYAAIVIVQVVVVSIHNKDIVWICISIMYQIAHYTTHTHTLCVCVYE